MSIPTSPVVAEPLDIVIEEALAQLKNYPAHSPEYAQIVKQIVKLNSMKPTPEKEKPKVDLNVMLPVLGNLAGIGFILQHERVSAVTSKALGFVLKTKV